MKKKCCVNLDESSNQMLDVLCSNAQLSRSAFLSLIIRLTYYKAIGEGNNENPVSSVND